MYPIISNISYSLITTISVDFEPSDILPTNTTPHSTLSSTSTTSSQKPTQIVGHLALSTCNMFITTNIHYMKTKFKTSIFKPKAFFLHYN